MNLSLRLLVTSCLCLLFITPVYSTDFRIWEPHDGKVIRSNDNISRNYSSATDEAGHVCVTWSDTRLDCRNIWAQLYSSDGTELWDDGGRLISNADYGQENPNVKYLGNGTWGITWLSYRFDCSNEIYIQKIDMDGNLLWGDETGLIVSTTDATSYLYHPTLLKDNIGGVYSIFYKKINHHLYVFAQHFTSTGETSWLENGICVASGRSSTSFDSNLSFKAFNDDFGSFIIVWADNSHGSQQVRMNKVTQEGELAWADTSGITICSEERRQYNVDGVPDGHGGAFITWLDTRDHYTSDIYDLYLQHVNTDGETSLEENGIEVFDFYGPENYCQIVKSDTNEAIIVTAQSSASYHMYVDIYAQKVRITNGSLQYLWGQFGINVLEQDLSTVKPALSSDLQGGAYISWAQYRLDENTSFPCLYVQHLDPEGNFEWNPNGIRISNREYFKYDIKVNPLSSSLSSIFWIEDLSNTTIMCHQVVDFNGDIVLENNGDVVITGIEGTVLSYSILPSTNGNSFVFWLDERYSYNEAVPFFQCMNNNTGEVLLDQDGRCMLPYYPENLTWEYPEKCTVEKPVKNAVAHIFQPYRFDGDGLSYIQKIDETGNILWGDRGSCVVTNSDNIDLHHHPMVLPMEDGGVMAVYIQTDNTIYRSIFAQRINSEGTRLWPVINGDGIQVVDTDRSWLCTIGQFSDGSVLILYKWDSGYYTQRILSNGETAWENPVYVFSTESPHFIGEPIKVGDNLLMVWEDQRTGSPNSMIYGQMICPDGSLLYQENGIQLIDSWVVDMSSASIVKSEDSFWIVWLDWRSETSDVYVQKFSNDLVPLLEPESGIQVSSSDFSQFGQIGVYDDNGGLYILWLEPHDDLYRPYYDLRFNHINSDGQYASEDYSLEGQLLSTGPFYRDKLVATSDGESGFIAAWTDARESTPTNFVKDIYTQRVNDWTVSVDNTPDVIPEGWSLENAYPNPFNPSTRIAFNVGNTSNVKLTIYDILGREVVKLVDGHREAGNHVVTWDGKNVAGQQVSSGTYFYRLEADDVMITKKMILMK